MLLGKGDAAIADRLVEARDCREAAVGERFVDERPQMFGRLQFGAVGGLEDEADAVGRGQVLWAVPASIVELKHDARALATGSALSSANGCQCRLLAQSVVGQLSAFGKLRLWRGEKSVGEVTQVCLARPRLLSWWQRAAQAIAASGSGWYRETPRASIRRSNRPA